MPTNLITAIRGLYTNPNPFSADLVPPGACAVLNNVVLDRGNIVTPRGALSAFATSLGGASAANAMKWFGGYLVAHCTDGIVRFLQTPATPTWQQIFPATSTGEIGTLAGPSASFPMRFCESGGNMYASTKWGVLRIQPLPSGGAYSALGMRAGCMQSTGPSSVQAAPTHPTAGLSGFLPADSAVAYRAIVCFKDAAGRIVRSAPTPRYLYKHRPMDIQPFGSDPSNFFVGDGPSFAAGNVSAARGTGSNLVTIYFSSVQSPLYTTGDTINVTFADNEVSTFFKSGTYTISSTAGSSGHWSLTYTVNTAVDPNPGSNQTATKLIKVRGPNMAVGSMAFLLPSTVQTTSHFIQIYRSEVTPSASITPSDEMRLCQELYGNGTNTILSAVDYASALVLGESLYTSPSQGGLGEANIALPRCKDLVEFQSCLFYCNTELLQTLKCQILTPTGTVTKTYQTVSNGSVLQTYSIVDPNTSVYATSELVQRTAENICAAIVQYNSGLTSPSFSCNTDLVADDISTVGLFHITSNQFDALPLELRTAFGPNTQPPTNPILPTANSYPGAFAFSDIRPNRVYFSKPQEPEHISAANFIDVGSQSSPILRGVVVQNSLFIIKSEGVFRITGDGYDFSVEPFDLTKNAISSESVQVVDNKIYFLSAQGVVEMDESGSKLVSRQIETDLAIDIAGGTPSTWQSLGSNTEHRYVLIERSWGDTAASAKCWVYNLETQSWTTWTLPSASAVAVDISGIPYLARGASGIGKMSRPLSSGVSDYGSAMACTIQPLPMTAQDPSMMAHIAAVKWFMGPVVGGPISVGASFLNELAAGGASYSISVPSSAGPQNLVLPVTRGQARCAQLTNSIGISVTNQMFQILGFEPIFQLGRPQKIGHR